MSATTLQVSVALAPSAVCEFLSQPRNYPAWASWLGPELRQFHDEWFVRRADGGFAKVRFAERNAFGVADHWLLADEDSACCIALRALPQGEGRTLVLLTLLGEAQHGLAPGAGEAQRDLQVLAALLEEDQSLSKRQPPSFTTISARPRSSKPEWSCAERL
jgi:hypothetical protein